jgi:hypothetical protein
MDPANSVKWRSNRPHLPYQALGLDWFTHFVPYNQSDFGTEYPDEARVAEFLRGSKADLPHVFKEVSVVLSRSEIHNMVGLTLAKLRTDKPHSKKSKPTFGLSKIFGGGRAVFMGRHGGVR